MDVGAEQENSESTFEALDGFSQPNLGESSRSLGGLSPRSRPHDVFDADWGGSEGEIHFDARDLDLDLDPFAAGNAFGLEYDTITQINRTPSPDAFDVELSPTPPQNPPRQAAHSLRPDTPIQPQPSPDQQPKPVQVQVLAPDTPPASPPAKNPPNPALPFHLALTASFPPEYYPSPSYLAPIKVDWTGPCCVTKAQRKPLGKMWKWDEEQFGDEVREGEGGKVILGERMGLGCRGLRVEQAKTSQQWEDEIVRAGGAFSVVESPGFALMSPLSVSARPAWEMWEEDEAPGDMQPDFGAEVKAEDVEEAEDVAGESTPLFALLPPHRPPAAISTDRQSLSDRGAMLNGGASSSVPTRSRADPSSLRPRKLSALFPTLRQVRRRPTPARTHSCPSYFASPATLDPPNSLFSPASRPRTSSIQPPARPSSSSNAPHLPQPDQRRPLPLLLPASRLLLHLQRRSLCRSLPYGLRGLGRSNGGRRRVRHHHRGRRRAGAGGGAGGLNGPSNFVLWLDGIDEGSQDGVMPESQRARFGEGSRSGPRRARFNGATRTPAAPRDEAQWRRRKRRRIVPAPVAVAGPL